MDRQEAKAILEAILFTMGESVEVERLAAVIEEDKKTTRQLLVEMKEEYDSKGGGITLMSWRIPTRCAPGRKCMNI